MKHISVLVPNGDAVLSTIVGSFKIFNAVNNYVKMCDPGGRDLFKIDLVGIGEPSNLYGGLFQVNPTKTLDEVKKTDLIIVTTIIGDYPKLVKQNAPFVKWIVEQRQKHNAEIASLCTGAFMLAETGLLDGKSCATHWNAHDLFRSMYPQINLIPEKIITEENGIYSSGGAYSFLNLLLYLVEKYAGREVAIWAAKLFEIEIDRVNQNQFVIFSGQKDHDDDLIKKAQQFVESNFEAKISVEDLANQFSVSRRNFVRRFKKATANTPLEYIQRVKIEAAKKSFESSQQNVNEVMYAVGYNDEKAFRNMFKKHTGLSPLEYKAKYNRALAVA